MDPLSQAVLGVMGSGLKKVRKRDLLLCSLWGALGGLAPDVDYFIKSSNDPLLTIVFHRQITHSIFFIPIGALIVSVLLKLFKVPIKKSYPFVLLGYATHGLLDSCTNYGTQLWWPLSTKREAWNLLAVIDPLVTLPLVFLIYLFLKKAHYKFIYCAWAYLFVYLGLQGIKKYRIKEYFFKNNLITHESSDYMIKPTIFNNFLWRVVVKTSDDKMNFFGYHHRFFGEGVLYKGDEARVVNREDAKKIYDRVKNGERDYERFRYFSQNFLHWVDEYTISDSRYSLLPNSSKPLWSISFREKGRDHINYKVHRKPSKRQRETLVRMLKGESLESQ